MNRTICYRGKIDCTEGIQHLIEKLEFVAESTGWLSQRINQDAHDACFKGIIVNPKGDCEPLYFIFDLRGRLRSLADLITGRAEPPSTEDSCFSNLNTASEEIFVLSLGLFEYLKKHYISDLIVNTESDCSETKCDFARIGESVARIEHIIARR